MPAPPVVPASNAERPHSARGRFAAAVAWGLDLIADVADFRRHMRLSLDGRPCGPCEAAASLAEVVTQIGDCDVCLTVVEVAGVDGCPAGGNHRVMNVRPRGRVNHSA